MLPDICKMVIYQMITHFTVMGMHGCTSQTVLYQFYFMCCYETHTQDSVKGMSIATMLRAVFVTFLTAIMKIFSCTV